MKKTALTLITLSLIVSGSAVVGGPNPDDGMGITSSDGSSSASKGVGPNGTQYTSVFNVLNVTQTNETGITDFSWNGDTFSFEGVYQTPTPCYQVGHQVEGSDADYRVEISADRTENGTCTQVVTQHIYSANFTSDEPFRLNVTYDGESVESFEHPDYEEQKQEQSSGLFSSIISVIVAIFN